MFDSSLVEKVPIKSITSTPLPLRARLGGLDELTSSIQQHGLLQPIVVRSRADSFEVVAGNRRLAACKKLRWVQVPCIILDLNDQEAFELALTENITRQTLDPIEEAEAFRRYIFEKGWGSVSQLAKSLGKSPSYVSQRLSLLKLPERIVEMIAAGEIPPSSAREFTRVKDSTSIYALAELVSNGKASSRDIQEYANSAVETPSWLAGTREEADSDCKTLRKSALVLKVAMVRLATLTSISEDELISEFLFSQKNTLHSMIDTTIRLSLKRRGSQAAILSASPSARRKKSTSRLLCAIQK